MTWVAVLVSSTMGVALGLLGGGGSIIAVPAFVYLLGFDAKVAIAMSLGIVGAVSAVGTIGHWREGNVNFRIAALFGVVAMGGTFAGTRLSVLMSGDAQLLLFSLVMLAAAVSMLKPSQKRSSNGRRPINGPVIVLQGLLMGVLTGLVGVGGGFLVVPSLVVFGGMSMKHAVGTSLLVIALNSSVGFAGYLGQVTIPWGFMVMFASVAAVGMFAGLRLTRLFPSAWLQRTFAVVLLLVGTSMLYANRAALTDLAHPPARAGVVSTVAHRVPTGDVLERTKR